MLQLNSTRLYDKATYLLFFRCKFYLNYYIHTILFSLLCDDDLFIITWWINYK